MVSMNKTIVDVTGNDIRFGIEFTKVNKENRTVSGFATLDNVDAHGDVIPATASREAFARFRGNLREMHQPSAVGKVVSFTEKQYIDPDSGDEYTGVWVDAYVSKGAPHTWEKVLDGTLGGFSIGGKIKQKSRDVLPNGGEANVIKEYDLLELSLVDNPANPLANVMSIRKMGDTMVVEGGAEELHIMYDAASKTVVLSEDPELEGFEDIGWVVSTDVTDEKLRDAINKFEAALKSESAADEQPTESSNKALDSSEGGATVSKAEEKVEPVEEVETEEVPEAVVEVEEVEEVEEVPAGDDEETAKAATVEEVPADEVDDADVLKRLSEDFSAIVKDALAGVKAEQTSELEAVNAKIDEFSKSVEEKISTLSARVDEVVGEVDKTTAVKKSADVVVEDDEVEKAADESNPWRGAFIDVNSLVG
jgi:hypothetical protein